MFRQKKYIVVFVVSEQGTYSFLKTVRFTPTKNTVRYVKGNTHTIDVSTPTYSKGLKLLYFCDIKTGQIIFKGDKGKEINPKLIDMVLKQSIIGQLTQSLNQKAFGGRILDILLGLAFGFIIGFIVAGFL